MAIGGMACIETRLAFDVTTLEMFLLPRLTVLSPIHDTPLYDVYFYFYLGLRRAEKNVICTKKNCDGKSSTICKIEYHINIEFSPNNIHISSHICDGKNGFQILYALYV